MKLRSWYGLASLSGLAFLAVGLLVQGSRADRPVGKWVPLGDLTSARDGACSVTLADGSTMIIGGQGDNGPLTTAESLRLSGGGKLASMRTARADFSCATLADGRVLVAGGTIASRGALNSAEIYDVARDTWSDLPPLSIARSGATASVIQYGGKEYVLIAGGETANGATPTIEIFDASANTFGLAAMSMNAPRMDHAAAVLADGRVLFAGGSDGVNDLNTIEIYEPTTGAVSVVASLSRARHDLSATTLLDGRVLLAGGAAENVELPIADVFDPASNTVTTLALSVARAGHSAFRLPDNNTVLLVGGISGDEPTATVERFIPWKDEFQLSEPLSSARLGLTGGAEKGRGTLFIAGGSKAGRALGTAESLRYAIVQTDQPEYLPGQTVQISGDGWVPGETVTLSLKGRELQALADEDGRFNVAAGVFTAEDLATAVTFIARGSRSDAAGSFAIVETLTAALRQDAASASGKDNGERAASTGLRLAAVATVAGYDQCSNDDGDGYATGDTGCRWINGNLNPNNSTISEGDSTVQRLFLDNLNTGVHTVTFQYGTTKGGKHAYDFLTIDKFSETWITDADMCDGTSQQNIFPSCATTPAAPDTAGSRIPLDPYVDANNEGANGFDALAGNASSIGVRHFRIRNGVITSVSAPSLFSGSFTADSEKRVTVTFRVNATNAAIDGLNPCVDKGTDGGEAICPVLITFGAHVAVSNGQWGPNTGATAIPGSPYHVSLPLLDGTSAGSRDNQMSANLIVAQPKLTLVKVVTNNNGGTATINDFPLTATGPTTITGISGTTQVTNATVTAGTYALSEATVPGYAASAWVCTGTGSQSGSNITLADGQSATCTITNDDIAPSLILNKVVVNDNGGTATASQFTLTATGPTNLSGAGPTVTSGTGFSAGTYALSETNVAGYSASSWVCTGTGTQNGSNIQLTVGQSATCTITNNDIPPSLTLNKVVVNNNGGTATASSFNLTATGTTTVTGAGPSVSSGSNFVAGTYALSETGPSGYNASAWSCVGGTQSGSNITVGIGQSATCTITNDDQPPSLTLIKQVVNDNGGTAVPENFTLTATGPTNLSGAGPNVASGASFAAGTYALSETGPSGYNASAWSCVGGTQSGSNITVGVGQSATCTITNNDAPPSLTLVKVVTNDNGGTAVPADFTLIATGNTPLSGAGPSVASGASFAAGTYALSETGPSGYNASAWSCVGGTQSGSNITVGLGQSATCTITNNDIPPSLTLVKVVTNDNGGTAVPENFTLLATGPTNLSGAGPNVASGATFRAGSYALSETGPSGYNASAWSCVGGTQNGANISIGIGQSATCTITNNDAPPSLTLVKQVVNDNGGTATPADFTLTASGPTGFSGVGPTVNNPATFLIGTYNLSENNVPGYAAGNWSCVGGTQSGASITLGLGQSATCTIINNDIAPRLTLIKNVVNDNGGTAGPNSFNLTVGGNGVLSGVTNTYSANVPLAINETLVAGYAFVNITGDAKCPSVLGGTVTLALADNVTCTITNNDIAPTLTLNKIVVNNNGGTATESNFTLFATGPTGFSGAGPTVLNGPSFDAGAYTLSETGPSGYAASAWVCTGVTSQSGASIVVGLAQNAVCTITNDDIGPRLTLVKQVINGASGSRTVTDFPLAADGPGSVDLLGVSGTSAVTNVTVSAGSYALSEQTQTDYVAGTWSCSGGTQNGSSVTLALAQSAICTITNTALPKLTIVKYSTGGTGTFGFTVTGPTSLSPNITTVAGTPNQGSSGPTVINPGSYTISESSLPAGWTMTDIACSIGAAGPDTNGDGIPNSWTFTAAMGNNITCTFINSNVQTTRTQGFWSTHTGLANAVWNGGPGMPSGATPVIGSQDQFLCKVPNPAIPDPGTPITAVADPLGLNQVMGGFWSSISQKTTGSGNQRRRSDLEQARMQMLQQYLAAVLNVHTFGSGSPALLSNARAAYCGTNIDAIKAQIGILGSFNESGDALPFTPGASATAPLSRSQANIPFWDDTNR